MLVRRRPGTYFRGTCGWLYVRAAGLVDVIAISLSARLGTGRFARARSPRRDAREAVERRMLVRIRVRRRAHRHVRDRVERGAAPNCHLPDADDFRGDVAHRVSPDEAARL